MPSCIFLFQNWYMPLGVCTRVGVIPPHENQIISMEENMEFAPIKNDSVTAYLLSYALYTPPNNKNVEVVWVEFPPTYPKVATAIWAQLVSNSAKTLSLFDGNVSKNYYVQPLKRAYTKFIVDCPDLAKSKKGSPKFVRLMHPNVGKIQPNEDFFILDRFEHTPGQLLAAAIEHNTSCPMMIGWGEYVLSAAQALGEDYCQKLITGPQHPIEGYWFSKNINWQSIVATGIEHGHLSMDGNCVIPASIPVKENAAVTA